MQTITGFIVLFFSIISIYSGSKINYMQPLPDAMYVNPENNITIGFDSKIGLNTQDILNSVKITGPDNKEYSTTLIKCDDDKKIILNHAIPFGYNQKITVTVTGKLLKEFSRNTVYKYSFNTSLQKVDWDPLNSIKEEMPPQSDVLAALPELYVTKDLNPSDGYLFLAPYSGNTFLEITDKNAQPYWYLETRGFWGDFKEQPNGNMTFYNGELHTHFEMDFNYNIIDSFRCGNGYITDIHELRLLSNGHALVLSYDAQIVDMSTIVPGGNHNATVTGLIIQEIDENKNVVFQWRSWDHFAITDALHENMLSNAIDYVHGNAIEVDNDGNLIISSRHLDEITKINRTTGDIMWRFGGKHNEFTFLGDTLHFTYQHAVRRISNGNITIYDNGNFHTPNYSRAVEYSLDEVNKTATLVWQYKNTPIIFGSWGGYVQRLENGNTLIGWGGTSPAVTEVKPDGTVVFEAMYPSGVYTYRAYKFTHVGLPVSTGHDPVTADKFSLSQNYPNPFNPSTAIKYTIQNSSFVELNISDAAGRIIKKLVSEQKKPGNYSVAFDGSNLASGIYFYTLRAGSFNETKKMILIK
jgi:hypothetical protein